MLQIYLIEIYKDFVINNRTPKGIRKGNSFIMVKDLLTLMDCNNKN